MFVRGALTELVKALPRQEMVNPCSRLNASDKGMSKERERKQWITGASFHQAVADGLWSGMGLNAKHNAIWVDFLPYDAHLPMGCITRSGVQVSSYPVESTASIVWAQPSADNRAIDMFLDRKVSMCLRTQCTKKAYTIDGAPDLAAALTNFTPSTRQSPSYNAADFKLCKPMADMSLPMRKEIVDKWLSPNVPANLQDAFRAMMVSHDKDYNKTGIPFELENSKRKAESPLPGVDAVTLAPGGDCPQSRAEVQAKHGDIKLKEFKDWNLLVGNDGTMFAEGGHSVECVLASECLAVASGDWVVGAEYDKAQKDGAQTRLVAGGSLGTSVGRRVSVKLAGKRVCRRLAVPTHGLPASMPINRIEAPSCWIGGWSLRARSVSGPRSRCTTPRSKPSPRRSSFCCTTWLRGVR